MIKAPAEPALKEFEHWQIKLFPAIQQHNLYLAAQVVLERFKRIADTDLN